MEASPGSPTTPPPAYHGPHTRPCLAPQHDQEERQQQRRRDPPPHDDASQFGSIIFGIARLNAEDTTRPPVFAVAGAPSQSRQRLGPLEKTAVLLIPLAIWTLFLAVFSCADALILPGARIPDAEALSNAVRIYDVATVAVLPLSGFVADRACKKSCVMFGLVCVGAIALAKGWSMKSDANWEGLLVVLFLVGLGAGIAMPAALGAMSLVYHRTGDRLVALVILATSLPLGRCLGNVITRHLIATGDTGRVLVAVGAAALSLLIPIRLLPAGTVVPSQSPPGSSGGSIFAGLAAALLSVGLMPWSRYLMPVTIWIAGMLSFLVVVLAVEICNIIINRILPRHHDPPSDEELGSTTMTPRLPLTVMVFLIGSAHAFGMQRWDPEHATASAAGESMKPLLSISLMLCAIGWAERASRRAAISISLLVLALGLLFANILVVMAQGDRSRWTMISDLSAMVATCGIDMFWMTTLIWAANSHDYSSQCAAAAGLLVAMVLGRGLGTRIARAVLDRHDQETTHLGVQAVGWVCFVLALVMAPASELLVRTCGLVADKNGDAAREVARETGIELEPGSQGRNIV